MPRKLNCFPITQKILSQEDPAEYGGFTALFEDFFEEVRNALWQELINPDQTIIDEYVKRISELVMQKLHASFWHRNR